MWPVVTSSPGLRRWGMWKGNHTGMVRENFSRCSVASLNDLTCSMRENWKKEEQTLSGNPLCGLGQAVCSPSLPHTCNREIILVYLLELLRRLITKWCVSSALNAEKHYRNALFIYLQHQHQHWKGKSNRRLLSPLATIHVSFILKPVSKLAVKAVKTGSAMPVGTSEAREICMCTYFRFAPKCIILSVTQTVACLGHNVWVVSVHSF